MKFFSMACVSFFVTASAHALDIVKNGESDYAIVISKSASPSVKWAATELRKYVRQISGAELPIVTDGHPSPRKAILLGKSRALDKLGYQFPWKALGEEGFALRSFGDTVAIAGSNVRGAMYGAEELLGKMGVRWYAPKATVVPKRSTITLPALDETQTPDFSFRWPFFWELNANAEWCAHTRTNAPGGIGPEYGGHNLNWNGAENFYQIVPPAKYFKAHPEYFSLKHGHRTAARGSQLCLTNPDVLQLAKEYAFKYFESHPTATTVGISPNDAGDGNCECAKCLAMDKRFDGPSGTQIWFVNQVADALKAHFPNRKLSVMTLAYQYTEPAPKNIEPRDNVLVTLCPIHCCEAHPYEQCQVKANQVFIGRLHNWAKVARGRLYIWHYNTNFAHYLLPFPDYDELAADIPMYHRLGVVGFFGEGAYAAGGGGAGADMRSYVMAKYLWNVNRDMDALVEEWCRGVYGKAWEPMWEYYNLMQKQVRFPPRGKGNHFFIYSPPTSKYLAPDTLEAARRLFRRAKKLADTDAARYYIEKNELGLRYVALYTHRKSGKYVLSGDTYAPAASAPAGPSPKDFLADLHKFGIKSIHEGRPLSWDESVLLKTQPAAHKVVIVGNGLVRAAIVPNLGARIIQLIDKRTGTNVFYGGDRGKGEYPCNGGYEEYSQRAYQSPGWNERYSVVRKTPTSVTLQATLKNGLKLVRTIRLTPGKAGVEIVSVLTNTSAKAVAAGLRTHPEYALGALTDCVATCASASGKTVAVKLDGAQEQERYFRAGESALGPEFAVVNRKLGLRLAERFDPKLVEDCYLNWSPSEGRFNLELWTAERPLASGQSRQFAHTITLEPVAADK